MRKTKKVRIPTRRDFLKKLSMLGLGSSIFCGVAANFLYDYMKRKPKAIGKDKLSTYTLYPVKRKMAQALEIIEGAENELCILGINALGPLHQGMEEIKRVLDNGGQVKVLLLDANRKIFKIREEQECMRQQDKLASSRLTREWRASVEILKDLNIRKKNGQIELRLHNEYPKCALVIGDGKKLQYNEYPTEKKNDLADSELPRGVSGETTVYDKSTDAREFEKCLAYFKSLWECADAKRGIKHLCTDV